MTTSGCGGGGGGIDGTTTSAAGGATATGGGGGAGCTMQPALIVAIARHASDLQNLFMASPFERSGQIHCTLTARSSQPGGKHGEGQDHVGLWSNSAPTRNTTGSARERGASVPRASQDVSKRFSRQRCS